MSTSVQLQQSLALIAAINDLDYIAIGDLIHESFTHCILPSSSGGFGKPVRTKQDFLDNVRTATHIIKEFNLQPPKEVIESKDVVILHVVSDGKTVSGKPYNNEYIFMFRFDGEKIRGITEFVDSKYTAKVLEEEAEALKNVTA